MRKVLKKIGETSYLDSNAIVTMQHTSVEGPLWVGKEAFNKESAKRDRGRRPTSIGGLQQELGEN